MKELAEVITRHLSNVVKITAALVVGIAMLKFLYRYSFHLFRSDDGASIQVLRINFGSALTLALELLLAADILTTAIAPTWDDIGKLASIAVLRTSLNYFLDRELRRSAAGQGITPLAGNEKPLQE